MGVFVLVLRLVLLFVLLSFIFMYFGLCLVESVFVLLCCIWLCFGCVWSCFVFCLIWVLFCFVCVWNFPFCMQQMYNKYLIPISCHDPVLSIVKPFTWLNWCVKLNAHTRSKAVRTEKMLWLVKCKSYFRSLEPPETWLCVPPKNEIDMGEWPQEQSTLCGKASGLSCHITYKFFFWGGWSADGTDLPKKTCKK